MRQPSAMPADDRHSGAAQLLGNGGKIEPYTIIIMVTTGKNVDPLYVVCNGTLLCHYTQQLYIVQDKMHFQIFKKYFIDKIFII
jgi:hypothetical protein